MRLVSRSPRPDDDPLFVTFAANSGRLREREWRLEAIWGWVVVGRYFEFATSSEAVACEVVEAAVEVVMETLGIPMVARERKGTTECVNQHFKI